MDSTVSNPRQQAHELIDRLDSGQVSAVVSILQILLDPASRAHGKDRPISEEETLSIADAWLSNRGIPDEQVLAEFDLTAEDFRHVGRTAPDK
jgi:hypothetical protein